MAGKWVKEGYKAILAGFFSGMLGAGLKIGLFKTSISITVGKVLADLTAHECDFSGYTAGGEAAIFWSFDSFTGDNHAKFVNAPITWTSSSTGTLNDVYGWFLYDNASSTLICAEEFSGGPYSMGSSGDSLTLNPALLDISE